MIDCPDRKVIGFEVAPRRRVMEAERAVEVSLPFAIFQSPRPGNIGDSISKRSRIVPDFKFVARMATKFAAYSA